MLPTLLLLLLLPRMLLGCRPTWLQLQPPLLQSLTRYPVLAGTAAAGAAAVASPCFTCCVSVAPHLVGLHCVHQRLSHGQLLDAAHVEAVPEQAATARDSRQQEATRQTTKHMHANAASHTLMMRGIL
jgi:hypothetical protein